MEPRAILTAAEDRRTEYIHENTISRPVPLCPEITLAVADEALRLWQKTEEQLGEIGLPPPFWAFAWAGGQALARYILDSPGKVRGRQVLDLGAGSGLVGIAAVKAGAAAVLAADPDPWACAAIAVNAGLNGVTIEVTSADLLDTGPSGRGESIETVLVGDLFYERDLAERVFAFLVRVRAAGATVLIGDPGRSYLPKDRLVRIAEYGVPKSRELEDADIKRTAVWRLA